MLHHLSGRLACYQTSLVHSQHQLMTHSQVFSQGCDILPGYIQRYHRLCVITFFSSFSDTDGDTPRMSYSFVSTTFAIVLLWMLLQQLLVGQRESAGGTRSRSQTERLSRARPAHTRAPASAAQCMPGRREFPHPPHEFRRRLINERIQCSNVNSCVEIS